MKPEYTTVKVTGDAVVAHIYTNDPFAVEFLKGLE